MAICITLSSVSGQNAAEFHIKPLSDDAPPATIPLMVGVAVRLHTLESDDVGVLHVPPPVEIGDLVASIDSTYRIVDVVTSPPGSVITAVVRVRPEHFAVAAK
jgi:hypothetical protein